VANAIFRYEVPVDDEWHALQLSGPVLHVDVRLRPNVVEVWALSTNRQGPELTQHFRVFGTGQPLPDGVRHVGTALVPGGLVWHLMERI
jgi:hypothetical protein